MGWPWPRTFGELSDLMRAVRESFDVYDAPLEGATPIASAVTDAQGRFALRCGPRFGFVVCSASGRDTRADGGAASRINLERGGHEEHPHGIARDRDDSRRFASTDTSSTPREIAWRAACSSRSKALWDT
jgi:hypothetical protein